MSDSTYHLFRFARFEVPETHTQIWKFLDMKMLRNWSVQFICLAVSSCLWPRGLQHARPLCRSPTPGVDLNLCPFSQWCHHMIAKRNLSWNYLVTEVVIIVLQDIFWALPPSADGSTACPWFLRGGCGLPSSVSYICLISVCLEGSTLPVCFLILDYTAIKII